MERISCLNCVHFVVCMKFLREACEEEAWNCPEGLGKWYEYCADNCENWLEYVELKGRQIETKLLKEIVQALKEGKVVVVGIDGTVVYINGVFKDEKEAEIFIGSDKDHHVSIKAVQTSFLPP